jgi:hypothetical protein
MTTSIQPATNPATLLWELVADELDIAPSLYQKAAARHTSLGEWLCRPESSLAQFRPSVRPQGSFRFGTVIKPLFAGAAYDLDQVVVLETLQTSQLSQADLKNRFGIELAGYAHAHGMQSPEPKHRCWRLHYQDELEFHLDSLPGVPAAGETVISLRRAGVAEEWARRAIAITDDRHPQYQLIGALWLTSNPSGFARWFEAQAALGRRPPSQGLNARASVEDVPAYEWRTPLQRAVQILKRHRDVMFQRSPDLAPISMIITNLAASAYAGEQDVAGALIGIVEHMGSYVRPAPPRVPNPTHPQEDYADKWRLRPELEQNFWTWLQQARVDIDQLSGAPLDFSRVARGFAIQLTQEQQQRVARSATNHGVGGLGAPAVITSQSAPRIETAPRPWRHG